MVIVDSADYTDTMIFTTALLRVMAEDKRFLFRTAAALPKILGDVTDRPLLTRTDITDSDDRHGGFIIVGSHVNKTTRQMEQLKQCHCPVEFVEFNQHLVLTPGGLEQEAIRVSALADQLIRGVKTVAVYTRRDRFDLPDDAGPEEQLRVSVEISDAVSSVVARLTVRPAFLIAKGGITSSDVGTKALQVYRATVMGQVPRLEQVVDLLDAQHVLLRDRARRPDLHGTGIRIFHRKIHILTVAQCTFFRAEMHLLRHMIHASFLIL